MNDYESYLLDALEQVQSWDLPDEDIPEAANSQAHLMANCCPDYYWDRQPEFPCTSHR